MRKTIIPNMHVSGILRLLVEWKALPEISGQFGPLTGHFNFLHISPKRSALLFVFLQDKRISSVSCSTERAHKYLLSSLINSSNGRLSTVCELFYELLALPSFHIIFKTYHLL